ncbi:MAG: DUF882 domain-containing protein [Mesorhizobium sp.]|nr:DUF882 domain-containing protein [Mesorhizobium sp.]MBL8578251.1 DUF882 domain-containing protein [Mesorhizobium sp.]
MLVFGVMSFGAQAAQAETRTLKLYFVHTKERAEITFKRNGRYDQAGLRQINNFLRDWRRNEPTKMDPRLLDAVWEAYRAVGAKEYINVVSAYRSPATNSMLRKRSKGVANKSQHMLGKAMDFYIPGVPLKKLRDAGLRAQAGGVGYYPTSGSPFVHMDVGNVRHWPRMSRSELVAVFPNGKTLHVPSDGKPLPGFEQALASYESRKKSGTTALALAAAPQEKKGRSGGLLAALFGGGADEEEDNSEGSGTVVASAPAQAPKPSAEISIVPPEEANPASVPFSTADEEVNETPQTIIAALPAREIPVPLFAPRPQVDVGQMAVASADGGAITGTTDPLQPDNIPFGVASAMPSDDGQFEELDSGVPLPSWRPDQTGDEAGSTLLALAPPTPQQRPASDAFNVAALIASDAENVATSSGKGQRLAAVAQPSTAKPKSVASLSQTQSPANTKTTSKGDRARVDSTKPAPKPQVVAAQPEAARWALGGQTTLAYDAGAPAVAHLMVRTAPSQVFANGFQRDTVVADASRFSGKAVSFMPVARFETN